MSEALKEAAREALLRHDTLRAIHAQEPPCGEDGLPLNPRAWLNWRETQSAPAYAAWNKAMDVLARELDEPNMSRHPHNFRPRCEAILS